MPGCRPHRPPPLPVQKYNMYVPTIVCPSLAEENLPVSLHFVPVPHSRRRGAGERRTGDEGRGTSTARRRQPRLRLRRIGSTRLGSARHGAARSCEELPSGGGGGVGGGGGKPGGGGSLHGTNTLAPVRKCASTCTRGASSRVCNE